MKVKCLTVISVLFVMSACGGSSKSSSVKSTAPVPPTNYTGKCKVAPVMLPSASSLSLAALPAAQWKNTTQYPSLSSPRGRDITGDNIEDFVLGFSQRSSPGVAHVVAINGATGVEVWSKDTGFDYFSTPAYLKINSDTTLDVVLGGRGDIVALNGVDGEILWQIKREITGTPYGANFYSAQVVDDMDGDGVKDLFVTSGGGNDTSPNDRIVGKAALISAKAGTYISEHPVNDGKEVYTSPLVVDYAGGNGKELVWGSGGETIAGSLWSASLSDLKNKTVTQSEKKYYTGTNKGIVAPIVAADMNGDCTYDLVVQSEDDARVLVIDGRSKKEIWGTSTVGYESYVSPTIGYFVGDDDVPDVLAFLLKGTFSPGYSQADAVFFDGRTGEKVWTQQYVGKGVTGGAVAVDLNADGRDEVIFGVNTVGSGSNYQITVLSPATKESANWGAPISYTSWAAPLIRDHDNNGKLSLFISTSGYFSSGGTTTFETELYHFNLDIAAPSSISWGGYLGTHGDLTFRN